MTRGPTLPTFLPEPEEPPPFERFVQVPKRAITDRSLTDFDRTVLMSLLTFLRGKTLDTTASNEEIAIVAGGTPRAVATSLGRLESSGYLNRSTDRSARVTLRRIELAFRTWNTPPPHDPASAPPCSAERPPHDPAIMGRRSRKRPPHDPASAPLPNWFETEEKPSNGATVLSNQGDGTKDAVSESAPGDDRLNPPAAPPEDMTEVWLSWLDSPSLAKIARPRLLARGIDPDAARTAPPESPPPDPPPAAPAPPIVAALPPASAAFDGAWSRIMSQAPQTPPGRPARRPEGAGIRPALVDARRHLDAFSADGSTESLAALVDALQGRWRDRKTVTRDFWRSALAEIRSGRLGAEEAWGMMLDADREGKHPARFFSRAMGEVLGARKNPPPGRDQTIPGGGQAKRDLSAFQYTTPRGRAQ